MLAEATAAARLAIVAPHRFFHRRFLHRRFHCRRRNCLRISRFHRRSVATCKLHLWPSLLLLHRRILHATSSTVPLPSPPLPSPPLPSPPLRSPSLLLPPHHLRFTLYITQMAPFVRDLNSYIIICMLLWLFTDTVVYLPPIHQQNLPTYLPTHPPAKPTYTYLDLPPQKSRPLAANQNLPTYLTVGAASGPQAYLPTKWICLSCPT